jgi:molybdopterin molybdotransferase
MIELKDALRIVLEAARPLGPELVDLAGALGRVLSEDIKADVDMPAFDKALVDGYACRRSDLVHRLRVTETIRAGVSPTQATGPGQCAKIMTGAAVPAGADCVIMVEQTESTGQQEIQFTGRQTQDHIARQAEDVRQGQLVLERGTLVGPQHVAILAAVGHVRPLVAKRPKVAVIAGGDELVRPGLKPGPYQIRDSNTSQLAAQLKTLGMVATEAALVKDVEADIDQAFKAAIADSDVVILSGGVSVGDYDWVPTVLRKNNLRLLFEKIAIKPGKPTVFGVSGERYCFGLPGNPVSTFVIFELLVRPFLYRLMGHDYRPACIRLPLAEPIGRKDVERQLWIPAKITAAGEASPLEYHGSGHILALARADALICVEAGVSAIEAGSPVLVRLI